MSSQGKNTIARQVLAGKTTLHNLIMSEDYYATNIDLWLLATKFKLPIIFFTAGSLIENNGPFLITYTDKPDSYFFIRTPVDVVANIMPVYKLVVDTEGNARIPINKLAISLQEDIRKYENDMSDNPVKLYIENFKHKQTIVKKKILVRKTKEASAILEPTVVEPTVVEPTVVEPTVVEESINEPIVKPAKKLGKKLGKIKLV
jgi:hypothetical protein